MGFQWLSRAGSGCTELSTNMTIDSLMLGEHLDNLDASMMQSGEPEWDCFYLDLNGERRCRRISSRRRP